MKPVDACNAFAPDERVTLEPSAAGKLSTLTFAVKELYDVKGLVTGVGNPCWKSMHSAAWATAPSVQMLLNEGATLMGKTISDEMAFSLDGENTHYGTPLNPQCSDRIPGGSSSGSASAVACGIVDFALGTDTAGSMRIPASYCGIYGFRPTHGIISMRGVHPMASSFDVAGWFARTPDILAKVGHVLLGSDIPEFNANKFIIARDLFGESYTASGFDTFMRELSNTKNASGSSVEIVESEIGKPDFATWIEVLRNIQWWELNQAHGAWISQHLDSFGVEIRSRLEKISTVSRNDMEEKMLLRKHLSRQIESLISPYTFVVFPTAPGVAPLKGRSMEAAQSSRMNTLKHTCIATVAGLPQISMPLMEQDGCPIGISLMGAHGQDVQLLAAAQVFGAKLSGSAFR